MGQTFNFHYVPFSFIIRKDTPSSHWQCTVFRESKRKEGWLVTSPCPYWTLKDFLIHKNASGCMGHMSILPYCSFSFSDKVENDGGTSNKMRQITNSVVGVLAA
jgi:hypothetical protein